MIPRLVGATVDKLGLVKVQTSIPRPITEKDACHDKIYLQNKKDRSIKPISSCVYSYS